MPSRQEVFDCPMQENDGDAATVGEYLLRLLGDLWTEREGFDGKRPFGNSGWAYDIYKALGTAGYIEIEFDEDGYIEDCDGVAGDAMIADLIASLAPR